MRFLLLLILCVQSALGAIHTSSDTDGGYINIKSQPNLDFTNVISISVWAYCRDEFGGVPRLHDFSLLSKENSVPNNTQFSLHRGENLGLNNDFAFYYFASDGTFEFADATGQTPFATTNVWKHYGITFSYSVGASLRFYIDGVYYAPNWIVNNGNKVVATNASIGSLNGALNTAGDIWNGSLTEIAIWNAILTDAQMALLAKSRIKRMPMQIKPESLVAYWPLDQGVNFTSVVGTNQLRNLAMNQSHGTGIGNPKARAESVCSYPPNE